MPRFGPAAFPRRFGGFADHLARDENLGDGENLAEDANIDLGARRGSAARHQTSTFAPS
jgi:hypothetical protein